MHQYRIKRKSIADIAVCLALSVLWSCGSSNGLIPSTSGDPLLHSMIFFIHGDGDYRYHDQNGRNYRADEVTLAQAESVAVKSNYAEVFIYHEKPRSNSFFFFQAPDGEFSYYRNGILFTKTSYWRDSEDFTNEIELYYRWHEKNWAVMMRFFLYFGHEIPEFGGKGYDASYPDREFTVRHLAAVLGKLTMNKTSFDVMMLSTCFSGTPYSVAALSPFTRYIIASPDNLHLSYFDFTSLAQLTVSSTSEEVPVLAQKIAKDSFDRLTQTVQTSVTVGVYDVKKVNAYVRSVEIQYNDALRSIERTDPIKTSAHCDCRENAVFTHPDMSNGVTIHYRPALFGRFTGQKIHSG